MNYVGLFEEHSGIKFKKLAGQNKFGQICLQIVNCLVADYTFMFLKLRY